jgi:hypothetical protein
VLWGPVQNSILVVEDCAEFDALLLKDNVEFDSVLWEDSVEFDSVLWCDSAKVDSTLGHQCGVRLCTIENTYRRVIIH